MTDSERAALRGFETHVRQLLESYGRLQDEIVNLRRDLSQKDDEIARLEIALSQWERKYSNLKLARMMSFGDAELKEGKSRITRLVRKVNKCIRLLEASSENEEREIGTKTEGKGKGTDGEVAEEDMGGEDFWGFKQMPLFSESDDEAVVQINEKDGQTTKDTHTHQ